MTEVEAVGPRDPCPCGSGRRYKACHGRDAARSATQLVARPFEGLPGECDLVAMATLVPAATATVTLTKGAGKDNAGREVTLATLLPMAWPALHRADGSILVGLQRTGGSGDASRDIAASLLDALESPVGTPVLQSGRPGPGPRLQDLLETDKSLAVNVHEGFGFWLDGTNEEETDEMRESLARADEQVVPTKRLELVNAAYWCRIGSREHVRWVMHHPEEKLLDAFARLHVEDKLNLGPGTKFVGSFRALGLLVAVWDLAPGDEASDVEEPAQKFAERMSAAIVIEKELSAEERRARQGLTSRQVTLR